MSNKPGEQNKSPVSSRIWLKTLKKILDRLIFQQRLLTFILIPLGQAVILKPDNSLRTDKSLTYSALTFEKGCSFDLYHCLTFSPIVELRVMGTILHGTTDCTERNFFSIPARQHFH